MSTTTITSRGRSLSGGAGTSSREREGDRVEFEIGRDGDVRVRPVTGAVDELFGMLRRPGVPPRSLEEIEEGVLALAREEDERVRRGDGWPNRKAGCTDTVTFDRKLEPDSGFTLLG